MKFWLKLLESSINVTNLNLRSPFHNHKNDNNFIANDDFKRLKQLRITTKQESQQWKTNNSMQMENVYEYCTFEKKDPHSSGALYHLVAT